VEKASGLAPVPAPPEPEVEVRNVSAEMLHWVNTVIARRISRRSGKPIKVGVVGNHRRAALDLAAFEAASKLPLTYEAIDARFFDAWLQFVVGQLQRGVGTFNHYTGILKSFFIWADYEGHPVNRRFREVLRPIEHHTLVHSLTEDEVLRLAALDFSTPEMRAYVATHFPEQPVVGIKMMVTLDERLRRLEHVRDKFLLCTYTALRIGDADALTPRQLHGDVARVRAAKTGVTCIIPLLDDDVFKPAALLAKYAGPGKTCLPHVPEPYSYLPHLQRLAGLERLQKNLGFHMGRKTFATLKVAQGVPRSQVMMVTGHQTESSFNAYLGIEEGELLDWYRKTARTHKKGGTSGGKSI
jgi:integrase